MPATNAGTSQMVSEPMNRIRSTQWLIKSTKINNSVGEKVSKIMGATAANNSILIAALEIQVCTHHARQKLQSEVLKFGILI